MEHRGVDGLLKAHAVMDAAEEQQELPLVLLVAAGAAADERGPAVIEGERRGERGARALAGRELIGMARRHNERLQTAAVGNSGIAGNY